MGFTPCPGYGRGAERSVFAEAKIPRRGSRAWNSPLLRALAQKNNKRFLFRKALFFRKAFFLGKRFFCPTCGNRADL